MPRLLLAALCLAFLAPYAALAAFPSRPTFGKDADDDSTVAVEFVGVEGALLENVRALSSLHRLAASPELDAGMVGRLVQRAPDEARRALKPFGYYEPEVTTGLTEREGRWYAVVKIEPGPPVMLVDQSVEVTGPGRDEPFMRRALERSALRTGERLSHSAYDALKGELLRAALGNGYLDAEFTTSELLVDPAARTARARLSLATGERYRFGPTTIEQDVVRNSLVRRYLRYDEGDWYSAEALLRTQFALDDSQYFSLAEVLPGERDRQARIVPVRITADKNRRHVYTIAAGYGTDTGARGTLGWEDRRRNESGHRLRAQLRVSGVEDSVGLTYVIPWSDPALEKLSFDLRQFTDQNADVETSGTTFTVALTQVRGRWQRVLSAALDSTKDRVTTTSGDSSLVSTTRSTLIVPGITFARLPPDFLGTNAVPNGFRAELLASTSALGSDTDFTRIDVRDDRRFRLSELWQVYVRAEIGASAVGDFQQLPAQYRFFAGGDNSVRGYGYEELSPVDENGNKVGGRHLFTATVELQRSLPKNLVAAVFVDAGNAFDKFGDPLEYSAGVGLRYRLPFLSVGLDVAQSISDTSRSPRFHINFTPEF
ncbi:MAG TPA: autotransporter assembly complex family protein [Steroidobacteraceae bacterium]|nr:autotransporter assembly complex family protein [Steroidobacteraceae bacterium]